jgi:hypothetical protein
VSSVILCRSLALSWNKRIGEQMDGSPLPNPDEGKNLSAVTLVRLGGSEGDQGEPRVFPQTVAARWPRRPPNLAGSIGANNPLEDFVWKTRFQGLPRLRLPCGLSAFSAQASDHKGGSDG